jgi:hypothetical protein
MVDNGLVARCCLQVCCVVVDWWGLVVPVLVGCRLVGRLVAYVYGVLEAEEVGLIGRKL